MSVEACAAFVERGDPDRFLATMTAPEADRARLWPLYAFNLEVARAPWASAEPLIAEMRLQFWRDVVASIGEGREPHAHDVSVPLAATVRAGHLPTGLMEAMIDARGRDISRTVFEDEAALFAHLEATSGNLMWLAALTLGAAPDTEPTVRDMGLASGIANWLVAVPVLEARGRVPLVDGRPQAVAALARIGLERLERARRNRGRIPARVRPALLTGWRAGALLRMAAAEPARVAEARLVQSEFVRRGSLLLRGLTGRW